MKLKAYLKAFTFSSLIVLLLLPSSAFTAGNIHFGSLEVHPSFGITYRHDDNIYLNDGTNNPEVDDNIMIYSPAIELKNKQEDKLLLLKYKADIYRYSDITKEDKTDNRLTALFDTKFASGLIFMLGGDYVDTADPATSEGTTLDERTQNTLAAHMGYQVLDRLAVIAKYRGINHDYDKAALDNQDRDETTVGVEMRIDLLPKTSFFFEYESESIEYDKAIVRDSDTDRVLAGIKGQVTPKVKAKVALGYDKRDYESAANEDFSTVVIDLKVTQEFSELAKLSIAGQRNNVESFYTLAGVESNFYTESKLSISFDQKINHKVSANLKGYFGSNEYNNTTRKDDLIGYSLDVNYDIQPWLTASVGYAYKERDSNVIVTNVNVEDYEDTQFFVRLKAWL